MSSATSIDKPADQTFRPAHFFVLSSLILATVGVVMARQTTPSNLVLISLAIGAAGAAAAGLYRMLAPLAMADVATLRERPSVRARQALEREKTLVLRSIKDLEFDRAMGKVSPQDFDEMIGRLRTRAMMLMKRLDDSGSGSGYGEIIERDFKMYTRDRKETPDAPPEALPASPPEPVVTALESCACGTANDADAAFCKRCGRPLASDELARPEGRAYGGSS